uniref:Uncharacterized protein n=1 Tax=Arundo donax TaxID=35708 RepID=A0A0A9H9W5_ARUDO
MPLNISTTCFQSPFLKYPAMIAFHMTTPFSFTASNSSRAAATSSQLAYICIKLLSTNRSTMNPRLTAYAWTPRPTSRAHTLEQDLRVQASVCWSEQAEAAPSVSTNRWRASSGWPARRNARAMML